MAKVREEIEVVGAEESAARVEKIRVAYANLERQMLAGKISADQYRRSTEGLAVAENLLTNGMQTSTRQMAGARDATENLRSKTHEARGAATLLAEQYGIHLPREMRKVLAESKVLGPALTGLFNFSVASVGIAILVQIGEKIAEISSRAFDWDGSLKQILTTQTELNKKLLEHQETMKELRRETALVGAKGSNRFRMLFGFSEEDVDAARQKVKELRSQIAELQKTSQLTQTRIVGVVGTPGGQIVTELTEAAKKAEKDLPGLNAQVSELNNLLEATGEKSKKAGAELKEATGEEATARAKKLAAALEKLRELQAKGREFVPPPSLMLPGKLVEPFFGGPGEIDPEFLRKIQESNDIILGLERNVQLERAKLAGNTVDQILAEESRRVAETEARLRTLPFADARIEEARVLIHQETSLRIAEANKQAFEKMAQNIDQFLDRVFLTARSFSDIWKQLWTQILRHFLSVISRMLAAWITGHQQMAAASAGGGLAGAAGGGGGGFTGFIKQLFGFGGGSSSSTGGGFSLVGGFSTSSTLPTTRPGGFTDLSSLQSGLPMSAGGGVGMGAIIPAGATLATGAKLSMGAQLAAMAPMLIAGGGLAGISALGFGGPGRGALAGALGGYLGTAAVAFMMNGGNLAAALGLGAAAGPIGIAAMAVGALIGALFGMSSRNKKKAQAMDILNAGRTEWKKIISDFEAHRIDYASAAAGVTQVWQQMVQQWSNPSLGKYGPIAIRNNEPEFRRTLQQIEDLQAKRQWVASSPMFNAAGEFEKGGFISPSLARPFGPLGIPPMPRGLAKLPQFAGGGAVPIIAHAKEFVVNAPATASVGRENMEFINRTGRLPGGPAIIVQGPLVQAAPGMSTEQLAEATIRKLERLLRDQGVTLRG